MRIARSTRAQRASATAVVSPPRSTSTTTRVSRSHVGSGTPSDDSATPPASRASEVRTQARKVRSLAST